MQEITISLSENVLKLSTVSEAGFKGVSADLDSLDTEALTKTISDLVPQITSKNAKKLTLNFIVEPQDVIFKFITIRKQDNDLEEYIVSEIRSKLENIALEDLYFSYHKIAPFIYQFVGIKKEELEKYINISNDLGISLKTVIPWVFALPTAAGINDPAIFLSKTGADQTVVLSEFGGIFFSSSFAKVKSPEELQKLVEELSVYKRKNPITKIYTFMYQDLHLNTTYDVTEVVIPNVGEEATRGYEFHLLADYLMDSNPDLLFSQLNLLSLLPVPVVADKKPVPMVYVGSVLTVLLLIAGFVAGFNYLKNKNTAPEGAEVLSEVTENVEEVQEEAPAKEQEPTVVLNKSDLIVRIENGAGIQGIAGETQIFLEEKGYTIKDIGNADESGRETTLLKFKPDKVQYKDLLSEDMKDIFTVVTEEDLDPSLDFDVLIVVGTDAQV